MTETALVPTVRGSSRIEANPTSPERIYSRSFNYRGSTSGANSG